MNDYWQHLKQRKLVQWAAAYLAGAWVLLQVIGLASVSYAWPHVVIRIAFGVLAVGFAVMLVLLAWYHGERGVQRVLGMELVIIALILVVGGGLLWRFGYAPPPRAAVNRVALSTSAGLPAKRAAPPASGKSAVVSAALLVAAQPIPAKSVAVLPFENLSADQANAYFAGGIQDLILTKLANIGDLKVISRTSTRQYGSHPANLRKIGEQLGVATFLEGTVQKVGNQVLINVQLIDAKTYSHIWAQSYRRTLGNIFGVEGEVATQVAAMLKAALTASERTAMVAVPTHNRRAYQAFLKGIYYLNNSSRTGDAGELAKSIAMTKKAVAADPDFANAWALLARGYLKTGDHNQEAEKAARRALALDPDSVLGGPARSGGS